MPRKRDRKSKVSRLPKEERRHPSPKVIILSPDELQNDARASTPQPYSGRRTIHSIPALPATPGEGAITRAEVPRKSSLPDLPDEIWERIMVRLNPYFVSVNLQLSTRLCNLSRNVLVRNFRSVLLATLFLEVKRSHPVLTTPTQWCNTVMMPALQRIPALEKLAMDVRGFVAHGSKTTHGSQATHGSQTTHGSEMSNLFLECVALVCSSLESTRLAEVVLAGLPIRDSYLTSLLANCPNIRNMVLTSDESIDDTLLRRLAACGAMFHKESGRRRLSCLQLNFTGALSTNTLRQLLHACLADSLSLQRVRSLTDLEISTCFFTSDGNPIRCNMQAISCVTCASLQTVSLEKWSGMPDVRTLNLSHCPKLQELNFVPCRATSAPRDGTGDWDLDLERLQLAGNSRLHDVCVTARPQDSGVINGVAHGVACRFTQLRELNLFGAHKLSQQTFTRTFGLSGGTAMCVMPRLQQLVLNGTRVERVVLDGYGELLSVDVSGCLIETLIIKHCPRLTDVHAMGKGLPLRLVDLVVNVACDVTWSMSGWRWELHDTFKSYYYP